MDSEDAARALHDALMNVHAQAARQAASEATAQGASVPPAPADSAALYATAAAVAALLAAGLAVAAGREALRRREPGKTGRQVAAEVRAHLAELSDAPQRTAAGAALHGTMNRARVDTWSAGPIGSLYASEILDGNTCPNCRAVDGRFICNTDDLAAYERLYTAVGGYVDCEGGARCRGTVTGAWRPGTDER